MASTGRPVGRPAKPVEQHRALGNPSHKPLPDAPLPGEGLPAASAIPKPPALEADGLALWNQIWSAGRTWLSPGADSQVITLLCQAQDESEQLRAALNSGEVPRAYELPNGSQITHPYVTQLKDLRVQMTAWLASLGFSPADRARMNLGEVRETDVLDDLERRRKQRTNQAAGG